MEHPTIISLTTYPVKSLRGISHRRVNVGRMGFELDRRWMLVDSSGMFLTQRDHPVLATLAIEHDEQRLLIANSEGHTVHIPIEETSHRLIPVTIWDDRVDAFVHEPAIDQFFSDVLGLHARLVRIPEAAVRPVDRTFGAKGDHVSFADGYPVLLTTTASLEDLNSRLATPVPMDRFRPNLVVSTSAPFVEESWTSFSSGSLSFRVVKRCARCVITTTDQQSGERTPEPLRTLASFRKDENAVHFGMNCIPDGMASLATGDVLHISP